jgi:glycosyltransferase involved in cell wall biosynthesis
VISLSLVCPAFNESAQIYSLLKDWASFLRSKKLRFEIVVCNDGSKDHTWTEVVRASREFSEVRGINFCHNQGAGFAMSSAIRASVGAIVVCTDSDGQFKIEDAYRFYEALQARDDLIAVVGHRRKKLHAWSQAMGTRVASKMANCFFGSSFPDFNCALKAVRGFVARNYPYESKGLNYSTELSFWLASTRAPILSLEVIQHNRVAGISSSKFFRSAKHRFLYLSYLWWKLRLQRSKIIQEFYS